MLNQEAIDKIISSAILEDMPKGDITSENLIDVNSRSTAVIKAKEDGVLAGIEIAERVFFLIDPEVRFLKKKDDGCQVQAGEILAEIKGCSISLLKAERIALNFLQRLSGIATLTRRYVNALSGTRSRMLDTRKTTPGLRLLEKYAVKMGGGCNHRMSLSDMAMLKDNHLHLAGSITEAVKRVRDKLGSGTKIEVETTNLDEVKEALESGADMIMLDNMSIENMAAAVEWVGGRVPLEASGNVDLQRIREIGLIGIDYISVGSVTHSYRSLDISMDFTA